MDSRRAILDALRRAAPPEVELPDVTLGGALPADPPKAFAEALAAVGGACVPVAAAELPAQVRALAGRLGAKRVAVVAPAAGEGDSRARISRSCRASSAWPRTARSGSTRATGRTAACS
jgi:hypothetical protein